MLRASDIPNAICVARILLVPLVVQRLMAGDFRSALLLIFAAGFSDALDGYLAKRFDWRTRIGGILDPLADKLLLVSVFLTLTWLGLAPLWLAVIVMGRDVVIVAGAVAYNFLIGQVKPAPTMISKVNTGLQLLFVLFVIARQASGWPAEISIVVIGAGVMVTSIVSGLDYVLRWGGLALAARRART